MISQHFFWHFKPFNKPFYQSPKSQQNASHTPTHKMYSPKKEATRPRPPPRSLMPSRNQNFSENSTGNYLDRLNDSNSGYLEIERPKIDLSKVKDGENCLVASFKSLEDFHIVLTRNYDSLQDLYKNIAKIRRLHYHPIPSTTSNVAELPYLFHFDTFSRVEVLEISDERLKCRNIDNGHSFFAKINELCELSPELKAIWPQAIKCRLHTGMAFIINVVL